MSPIKSRISLCVKLKNLDLVAYREGKGYCPSDFGVVSVSKNTAGPGYFAHVGELNDPNELIYGLTPSHAYLNCVDQCMRDADLSQLAKIVQFPQLTETVRPAIAAAA